MEQFDTSLRDHFDNLKESFTSAVKESEKLILKRIDGLEARVNEVEQEMQSLKTRSLGRSGSPANSSRPSLEPASVRDEQSLRHSDSSSSLTSISSHDILAGTAAYCQSMNEYREGQGTRIARWIKDIDSGPATSGLAKGFTL